MSKILKSGPSRRSLLLGASAGVQRARDAGDLVAVARAEQAHRRARRRRHLQQGVQRGASIKPFTKATGIECVGVQAAAEPTAQIKSMVDTKTYTWDMAKISWPAIALLTTGEKIYLEKHGLEADPVDRNDSRSNT